MKNTRALWRTFSFFVIITLIGFVVMACGNDATPSHDCNRDGHIYGNWALTTPATCEMPGMQTRNCQHAGCGHTDARSYPQALGHHMGEWEVYRDATSFEYGKRRKTCQRGGCDHYETQSVSPTHDCTIGGHIFGEWAVTVEPTCTMAGVETGTCQGCGHTTTRPVSAVGHAWGEWIAGTWEKTRGCRTCGGTVIRTLQRMSAGNAHTLAITENRSLWAWGSNMHGQLGDGTSGWENNRHNPIQIQPGTAWTSVSAGHSQSMAIRADGTLWAWGNGHLGEGTITNRPSPIQIGSGTDWAAVDKSQKTAIMATKAPVFTLGKSS